MPLRGAAYETLRNGVRPPNLCFLNARDQLYFEHQSNTPFGQVLDGSNTSPPANLTATLIPEILF